MLFFNFLIFVKKILLTFFLLINLICIFDTVKMTFEFMKNIFFIIIFFLLFIGCKKKKLTFNFKGEVTDLTLSKSLSGATLTFEEILANGTSTILISDQILGEDGRFEFEFERKSALKYTVTISKENYFTVYEEIPFGDFSTEKTLVKNYKTTAKSWVKLVFKNVVPSSESDLLRYIKQLGKVNCETCCPNTEQQIYGIADEFRFCVNDANTVYSYYYWSQNPNNTGTKEIYTPAFDTVELVLNY